MTKLFSALRLWGTMIVKHCESKGIKVITCLPVSKKNDTDDPPSFTSFRLCVPAAEFNKVMSPSNWPSSVLIREWIFNKNDKTINNINNQSSNKQPDGATMNKNTDDNFNLNIDPNHG
ncbi:hypothetical protein HELRODRAFT_184658 [Helobdella robusta]|uniref:Uncharacterized protein n=1 Tax=Helobdella robusta TaxID=6412 RepID=T1FLP7_HELRO|nr:hypothetical protein HELRODRAFT_184658 [Helobdella robusta]ESO07086.1 hypothetical protein HELRODRAFT_184658 [Helobdella robusta]